MTAVISADPADLDNTMAADRQDEDTAEGLAVVPSLVEKEGEYEVHELAEENARLNTLVAALMAQNKELKEDKQDLEDMLRSHRSEENGLRDVLDERNDTLRMIRRLVK